MPIVINARAANGITVNYHKAVKLEINLNGDVGVVSVCSYTNEEDYVDGLPVAWMWSLEVPVSLLMGAGTINEALELALTTVPGSPFLAGNITSDQTISLDKLKCRKVLEIDRARLSANRGTFDFGGKEFSCDELSRSDIDAVTGLTSLIDSVPVSQWKAVDDTYIDIPDKATWISFYVAMVQKGQENYEHSQALKAALILATTPEEVAEIVW